MVVVPVMGGDLGVSDVWRWVAGLDAAVNQPRADGFDVRDEDVVRLSPFVRHHINTLGRYSFRLPELPGGPRPLRDPDAAEEA